MSVIKYPTSARNIIKAINGNMVSVTNAGLHYKGEDKSESITPEALISDLEFYSESESLRTALTSDTLGQAKRNLLSRLAI